MMTILLCAALAIAIIWTLAYHAATAVVWSIVVGIGLLGLTAYGALTGVFAGVVWVAFILLAVVSNLKSLRQSLVTARIFKIYKKLLPQMSQTEREALDAGTVWWDGDLFSGSPTGTSCLITPHQKLRPKNRPLLMARLNNCARWSTSGKLPTN